MKTTPILFRNCDYGDYLINQKFLVSYSYEPSTFFFYRRYKIKDGAENFIHAAYKDGTSGETMNCLLSAK